MLATVNNIALNGTAIIKLNGSGVNDVIQAGGNITYGGTLNLVNVSGTPLASGDSFQVFNATSFSGSFASITPATPGQGLAWDTTQLGSGLISVSALPVINNLRLSGTNLIFSGSGGIALGTYYIIAATNLTTTLTNWRTIATNEYDSSGNFSVTNTLVPGVAQSFYRIKQ
jgi:hypothetical protein